MTRVRDSRASCPRVLERDSWTPRTEERSGLTGGARWETSEGNARHERWHIIPKRSARKAENEPRVVDVLARLGRATVRPGSHEPRTRLGPRELDSTRACASVNRNGTVEPFVPSESPTLSFRHFRTRSASAASRLRPPPCVPARLLHAPLKDYFRAYPRVHCARRARGRGARR